MWIVKGLRRGGALCWFGWFGDFRSHIRQRFPLDETGQHARLRSRYSRVTSFWRPACFFRLAHFTSIILGWAGTSWRVSRPDSKFKNFRMLISESTTARITAFYYITSDRKLNPSQSLFTICPCYVFPFFKKEQSRGLRTALALYPAWKGMTPFDSPYWHWSISTIQGSRSNLKVTITLFPYHHNSRALNNNPVKRDVTQYYMKHHLSSFDTSVYTTHTVWVHPPLLPFSLARQPHPTWLDNAQTRQRLTTNGGYPGASRKTTTFITATSAPKKNTSKMRLWTGFEPERKAKTHCQSRFYFILFFFYFFLFNLSAEAATGYHGRFALNCAAVGSC